MPYPSKPHVLVTETSYRSLGVDDVCSTSDRRSQNISRFWKVWKVSPQRFGTVTIVIIPTENKYVTKIYLGRLSNVIILMCISALHMFA